MFARRIHRDVERDIAASSWDAFLEEDRKGLTPPQGGAHTLKFFDEVKPGDSLAIGS